MSKADKSVGVVTVVELVKWWESREDEEVKVLSRWSSGKNRGS